MDYDDTTSTKFNLHRVYFADGTRVRITRGHRCVNNERRTITDCVGWYTSPGVTSNCIPRNNVSNGVCLKNMNNVEKNKQINNKQMKKCVGVLSQES